MLTDHPSMYPDAATRAVLLAVAKAVLAGAKNKKMRKRRKSHEQ